MCTSIAGNRRRRQMADSSHPRSQPKGARRTGRGRSSSGSKQEPFRSFEAAPAHQGFDQTSNTGAFGKQFERHNGAYLPESGTMRDLQLNGSNSYTPNSESSESERISALYGSNFSRTLPTDTIGLQQYRADINGEMGRLAKVSASQSFLRCWKLLLSAATAGLCTWDAQKLFIIYHSVIG